VMIRHNKQVEGPERIMKFIHNHFGSVKNFDSIVYLSQMNQAEAIKTGVEHWRERKYKTSGTLYWQLNDSWPVFSWSSIDYFKRPKALYHYTKRFYADLLPLIKADGKDLRLVIVNDSTEIEGHLEMALWTLDGKKVFDNSYDVRIPSDSVLTVDNLKIPECDLKKTLGFIRLKIGDRMVENHELFANLRRENLEDPKITFKKSGSTLEIKAEKPAFGVRITTEKDEVLEDNFFAIAPDHPKRIKVPESEFRISSAYDFLK
jgi:beta-mannosidase